jgi:hypothetical protein
MRVLGEGILSSSHVFCFLGIRIEHSRTYVVVRSSVDSILHTVMLARMPRLVSRDAPRFSTKSGN